MKYKIIIPLILLVVLSITTFLFQKYKLEKGEALNSNWNFSSENGPNLYQWLARSYVFVIKQSSESLNDYTLFVVNRGTGSTVCSSYSELLLSGSDVDLETFVNKAVLISQFEKKENGIWIEKIEEDTAVNLKIDDYKKSCPVVFEKMAQLSLQEKKDDENPSGNPEENTFFMPSGDTEEKEEEISSTQKNYLNSALHFSIDYPDNWIYEESDNGVGFGTVKSKTGGFIWSIYFYDKNVVDGETIISRLGSQFEDRQETREPIIIDGITAQLITVTTEEIDNWTIKVILFEHDENVWIISDGAWGEDDFAFATFYSSFKFLE